MVNFFIERKKHTARYYSEALSNGIELEMVLIREGKFMMGAPETELDSRSNERPQHLVTVPTFFMGKYPVTQEQWQAVAALPQINRNLKAEPSQFKGDKLPVEQVSWEDAKEFCARLSRLALRDRLSKKTGREYRLPTEAEWEYACRAGTTTPFHFGETISAELANYYGKATYGKGVEGVDREQTTPVGYFKVANAFGLYDMHGNVFEWCEDDWHDNYENAPTDGSAWSSGDSSKKVLRGGSWHDNPHYCRSAFRVDDSREDRLSYFGVRVVCVVPRTTK